MHIKSIIYLFFFSCFIFSCTDETGIGKEKPIEIPEGKTAIRISLSGLGTKAKSYSTFEPQGTAAENKLDSVMIFLFDNNKGDTLVNVYTLNNPVIGEDTTMLIGEKSSAMKFIALANAADSIVRKDWIPYIGVIDKTDFEKMTTLQSDSMPKPSLLMSAENKEGIINMNNTEIQTAHFELTRRVARIDIINRDSLRNPEDGQQHVFKLEKAKLVNIPSTAFLHGVGTPSNAKSLTPTNEEFLDDSDSSTGTMFSQLYIYPKKSEADNEIKLYVSGKYNGEKAEYFIPFGDRNIQANHRYVVTLDSVRTTTIKFDITVVDWDTDTIKFVPDNGGVPTVTLKTLPGGVSFAEKQNGDEYDTIRISTYQSKQIVFEARHTTVAPTYSVNADWITITDEEVISYSTDGFAKKYTVSFDENTQINQRSHLIHFVNPAKPEKRKTYLIIQHPLPPLARFAKANLTTTLSDNQYTIGIDLDKTTAKTQFGAWFQWGRKIAFDNNKTTITPDPTKISFANAANTTGNFIGLNNQSHYVWHTEKGHPKDVWTSLVNYSGGVTVNSDPCPKGFRIPTVNDWLTVTPGTIDAGTFEPTKNITISTEIELPDANQVTIKTGPSSYKGIADGTSYKTIFGIKTINGEKFAYRWRYYATNLASPADAYLEICCMPVLFTDATGTATTVALYKADTDWSEANGVVIRYFPAAGYRQFGDGTGLMHSNSGYYWSSSAFNEDRGWFWGLSSVGINYSSNPRTYGFSIRCVAQ